MNASLADDPGLHEPGSIAASGQCSHHAQAGSERLTCTGDAMVSFQDQRGEWQSGCSDALEQLVEAGEIEPLGQGA
jgi:hypothetical protein